MKHQIGYDAKCQTCKGTGVYVGMAERDGSAIVCNRCNGAGWAHVVIEYEDPPEQRIVKEGVRRVYKVNPGIYIGEGEGFNLEDFGGMAYTDWLNGEPFPPKSEMRKYTCPNWWWQLEGKGDRPDWCPVGQLGRSFTECKCYGDKATCWDMWDLKGDKDE